VVVSAPVAPAPSPGSAGADRREVHHRAPVGVALEVRHDPSLRYALADAQAPGPFAILAGGCATRAGVVDAVTRCEVELALLDLGSHAPVLRLDASGRVAEPLLVTATAVRALPVTDVAVPARELPLRGMPEPVPLYVPTWEPAAWIAVAVAVGVSLAVAAVRRGLARLRAAELRRASLPPEVTPSEALEARLDALAAAPPAAGAEPWFALAHAVRAYVAALSPRASLDRTTAELVAALRAQPIGGLDLRRFAEFAADLDRARFAGSAPGPEAWARALASARAILEATRPPRWHPDEEARRA
jgi:hypothetical protein